MFPCTCGVVIYSPGGVTRSLICESFTPSAYPKSRERRRGQPEEQRAEIEDQEQPASTRSFSPANQIIKNYLINTYCFAKSNVYHFKKTCVPMYQVSGQQASWAVFWKCWSRTGRAWPAVSWWCPSEPEELLCACCSSQSEPKAACLNTWGGEKYSKSQPLSFSSKY